MIDAVRTDSAEGSAPSAGPAARILNGLRHPIARRAGRSLLVALSVMVLSFAVLRLAPGDPALALVGDNATPEELEAMRDKLGLNGSLLQQFWEYLGPLLRGDLGTSIVSGQPVTDIVADSLPVTMWLIAVAIGLALGISLVLAVPVATHRFGVPGVLFRVTTSTLLSIPVFFSGQLLILLAAIRWGILPAGGYDPTFPANLRYLLLPALTACGPLVPILLRVLQSSVVETMGQAFVESAQVRGLSGPRLLWRYLLRPSLGPTIALTSYIVGSLFGAAVVLELVFNLPGIGTRLLSAVFSRDYPVVQGVVFVVGILVVAINFLGDLVSGWLDPRARAT